MSPMWSVISRVKQGSKPARTLNTYGRSCLLLQSTVMSREPQLDHVKKVKTRGHTALNRIWVEEEAER